MYLYEILHGIAEGTRDLPGTKNPRRDEQHDLTVN